MLKISVRGLDDVRRWLASLSKKAKYFAEEKVGEYLVGDPSHGLKHYPNYKYVTMEEAGGWKSDKQRRYVMAMINEGKITPGVENRTMQLQQGWELVGNGTFWTIKNDVPYARWVLGDTTQARMHELIGWRKLLANIQDNIKGAFRHANAELKKWLKTQKK